MSVRSLFRRHRRDDKKILPQTGGSEGEEELRVELVQALEVCPTRQGHGRHRSHFSIPDVVVTTCEAEVVYELQIPDSKRRSRFHHPPTLPVSLPLVKLDTPPCQPSSPPRATKEKTGLASLFRKKEPPLLAHERKLIKQREQVDKMVRQHDRKLAKKQNQQAPPPQPTAGAQLVRRTSRQHTRRRSQRKVERRSFISPLRDEEGWEEAPTAV